MADKPLAALDYLAQPDKHPPLPVCAVFGDETFLRRQAILCLRSAVLGGEDGDFSLTAFDGRGTPLRDVLDEFSTVAMFGGGQRLVVVEEADDFVSRWRAELEDYVARPSRSGVLVLELDSLPSNTRLYKLIAGGGLLIDCHAPHARPADQVADGLGQAAARRPALSGGGGCAGRDRRAGTGIAGSGVGQARAAGRRRPEDHAGDGPRNVGGWRAKTTWEMLDAAMDGKIAEAMLQLDRLLSSGEQPVGLLGQISASLRRFAAATRLILQAEKKGRA